MAMLNNQKVFFRDYRYRYVYIMIFYGIDIDEISMENMYD